MISKAGDIISIIFALLATWVILAAIPYFWLNGIYPQVDSQIIFLYSLTGLMSLFIALMLILKEYNIKYFYHPLIFLPFLLAFLGLLSSFFSKNFHLSLVGSPQVGQGVFWYFSLGVMSVIFSQIMNNKKVRLIIFINLSIITVIVTFFSFFPFWKKIPISFYYFTDYLCFYGVLCFISLTSINKNKYVILLAYLLLGFYFSYLDNRAAVLFWFTSAIAASFYYFLRLLLKYFDVSNVKNFLYSNFMFLSIIVIISFLMLFSSLYFYPSEYALPYYLKDTLIEAPIVRGKIFETSILALNNFKTIILGTGWGVVPDLLLENMSSWQFDQLRLGYNLHFHTHNDLVEHLVSLGITGGLIYLVYLYFIFKESEKINILSKFGWLLFFKINCFWFMWTGTFTLFAVVVSSFIFFDVKKLQTNSLFEKNYNIKYYSCSFVFILLSCFLFYGAYITYSASSVNSKLTYSYIVNHIKKNKKQSDQCLNFYKDSNRGGIILDLFLSKYSSFLFDADIYKIMEEDKMAFNVLYEVQCKANEIVFSGNYTSSLLASAMHIDTSFYYKFGETDIGLKYLERNYENWFNKAFIIARDMPKRGDLILPFLSYAVNNNKIKDAEKICKTPVKRIEAFCDLITANKLLTSTNINKSVIKNSIELINKAVDKGIFNELAFGKGFSLMERQKDRTFHGWGLEGIPLSSNILFLITDEEKIKLEEIIQEIE